MVSCCKAFTIRDTLKLVSSSRLTRFRITTRYMFAANKMKVVYTEQANQKVMLALLLLTFCTWKHKTIVVLFIYCLLFIINFLTWNAKLKLNLNVLWLLTNMYVCVCVFLHTCIKYLLLCSKSFWWLIWSVKRCYRSEAWSLTVIAVKISPACLLKLSAANLSTYPLQFILIIWLKTFALWKGHSKSNNWYMSHKQSSNLQYIFI